MDSKLLANRGNAWQTPSHRWMMFVDGENLVAQAQALLRGLGHRIQEGPCFRRDVFIWLPDLAATWNLANPSTPLFAHAIRSYYYTTVVGSVDAPREVAEALKGLGFTPRVFPRQKNRLKAKGLDITLATDVLSHAFQDHFDAAVLVAGDGDYVPLVDEVKRLGKPVYVAFPKNHGLSPDLHMAADEFFDMEWILKDAWAK